MSDSLTSLIAKVESSRKELAAARQEQVAVAARVQHLDTALANSIIDLSKELIASDWFAAVLREVNGSMIRSNDAAR